jgi:hypothetical protein
MCEAFNVELLVSFGLRYCAELGSAKIQLQLLCVMEAAMRHLLLLGLLYVHRVNQKNPPRSILNEALSASTVTFSGLTSDTGRHRGTTLDFGPYT